MENNNHNQQGEITLREFFGLITASKKLIVITTLIVTIAAAIYTYSTSPKETHMSTTRVIIGTYDDNKLLQMDTLEKNLAFLFELGHNKVNRIEIFIDDYFQIYTTGLSTEAADEKLQEIIEYILTNSQIQAKKLMSTDEKILNYEENKLSRYLSEMEILRKNEIEYNPDHANLTAEFIENYRIKIDTLIKDLEWDIFESEFRISTLLDKINTYQPTKIVAKKNYKDSKKTNKIAFIFSSFIAGLILSMFVVYILNPKRNKQL